MKIQINGCTHCPKMPDCEHRAMVKQADVPVRTYYHCRIYPTVFSKKDLTLTGQGKDVATAFREMMSDGEV